jgi:hypothetical protein
VSAALTSVLGRVRRVSVSGVAAYHVSKQQKDGSVRSASRPADQVIGGINAVIAQANTGGQAEVNRVKDAATQAVNSAPVLGPLAKQAIDSLT